MNPAVSSLAFTDTAVRPWSLTIDGLTVLGGGDPQPSYRVPIESIEVTAQGPGGTSSMTFSILDPLGVLTIAAGAVVRYWDHRPTHDMPVFLGYVDTWGSTPLGLGRRIEVIATGIEAMLDWAYVPIAVSWNGGDPLVPMQAACGAAQWPGGVALNCTGLGNGGNSLIASPIGFNGGVFMNGAGSSGPGTLRKVLQDIADNVGGGAAPLPFPGAYIAVDVGFWGELRAFLTVPSSGATTTDYGSLSVNATGTTFAPTDLQHRTSPGDATRTVVVTPSGGGTPQLVTDGTGIPGRSAAVTGPPGASVADLRALGAQILARNASSAGGDVILDQNLATRAGPGVSGSPNPPGTGITVTDAQAGVSGFVGQVSQIVKTWVRGNPGSFGAETWRVTYGARRSGAEFLRSLTAGTVE